MDYVSILRSAGLGATDVSKLLGVNRITVCNWFSGRSSPHSMIQDKVTALVNMSAGLLNDGKLPLKGVPRAGRSEKLKKLFSAT
jgi:hypothetical protein